MLRIVWWLGCLVVNACRCVRCVFVYLSVFRAGGFVVNRLPGSLILTGVVTAFVVFFVMIIFL